MNVTITSDLGRFAIVDPLCALEKEYVNWDGLTSEDPHHLHTDDGDVYAFDIPNYHEHVHGAHKCICSEHVVRHCTIIESSSAQLAVVPVELWSDWFGNTDIFQFDAIIIRANKLDITTIDGNLVVSDNRGIIAKVRLEKASWENLSKGE